MHYLSEGLSKFFELIHNGIISVIPSEGVAYGLAIVIFTIIVRLILLPLNIKQMKSTQKMSELQPEVKKLQDKYKNDPQRAQQEMMKLYKEYGVSPFSGCLPLLIQMPILFALYYVFQSLPNIKGVYFLWFDLGGSPVLKGDPKTVAVSLILPIIMAVTQYLSAILMSASNGDEAQVKQAKMMNIFMTVFMIWISFKFTNALILYWVVFNLFQVVQSYVMKLNEKKNNA